MPVGRDSNRHFSRFEMMIPRWVTREPLIGFLILGGGIFLLNAWASGPERQQIVLSPPVAEDLLKMQSELLGRPLAPPERQAVIQAYLDNEVLVREAVARGLYLDDARVRKRLTDKMNFLLSDEPTEPTGADLQTLYDADPKRYRTPKSISFEHIFFNSDEAAAEAEMGRIRDGEEPAEGSGDRFWLGRQMPRYAAGQLLTLFGYEFERALRELPVGEWQGPIRSARGWHLVKVLARHEPEDLPEQERLRRLRADWDARYREQSRGLRLAELRNHYEIVMPEPPEAWMAK